MKKYLAEVVRPLLINPEALAIVESEDDRGKLLTLTVSKPDMNFIIGTGGKTINAVRILIHTLAAKSQERVSVKVADPIA